MEIDSKTDSFAAKDSRIALSRTKRIILFITLCSLRSFIVINMSALSASVESIKVSLNISNQQFSQFSTFFVIGRIVSSIAFVSYINVFNRKYMLILILTLHCICLTFFANITSYALLLVFRAFNGYCILFCFVYFPIWVDQFGIQKQKSLMMTSISLVGSGGLIWGYLLNLALDKTQWRLIFLIEAAIVAFHTVVLCCFPSNYYDKSIFFNRHEKQQTETQGISRADVGMVSIFDVTEQKADTKPAKNESTPPQKKSSEQKVCTSMFALLTMAKSVYYFIGGAGMFWFANYLQTTLQIADKKEIVLSYSIIFIIVPCIGQVLGGFVCTYIGGYESKNALLAGLLLLLCSTPFALTVPFVNDIRFFTFFLSGFTFFENASTIITNALVIVSVSKEIRGKANGLFSLLVNIFGILPSASLYEFVNNKFSYLSNKAGMFCIMFYSIVGVSLMTLTLVIQIKNRREKKEELACQMGEEMQSPSTEL